MSRVAVITIAVVLVAAIAQLLYLSIVLWWNLAETRGGKYYATPAKMREHFRRLVRLHATLLTPILSVLARLSHFTFEKVSITVRGVAAPRGTCTPESLQRSLNYTPVESDLFVVTQMKCGTTWMQHLTYQVLTRGQGDLVGDDSPLYSVSPWIEAETTVPVERSPLIGNEVPCRLIKTHLPAHLCPFQREAKYIYVVRHPVSCFASCADFLRANLGAFAPKGEDVESWFMDESRMWWGTWPSHVRGWYERSQTEANVLFVRFEDMKSDLAAVARDVAALIGMAPLSEDELAAITAKCGFEYMKTNGEFFEMHPPHIINQGANLFFSGRSDRRRDVDDTTAARILQWCQIALKDVEFEVGDLYRDLAHRPAGSATGLYEAAESSSPA